MTRLKALIGVGLAFIFCISIIQATQEAANASSECHIIRIQGKDVYGGLRIEPEYAIVGQAACVIWTNWVRFGLEVMINFEDGKTCQDVTKAPGGFSLNEQNCYVTTWLGMGDTSSLVFMELGKYRYKVVTTKGDQILQGNIEVVPSDYTPPPKSEPPAAAAPIDSDGDGVPNSWDKCPNTIQGMLVDEKGCPRDTDKDGIIDTLDRCPRTPKGATVNEFGCWVCKNIKFDFDKSDIKPEYLAGLDEQVKFLKQNIDLPVEIQGHTDNVGKKEYNLELSEKRAIAVMNYFISKGVPKERLTAKGYGISRPLASNDTDDGRAKNRRVQLSACYDIMK